MEAEIEATDAVAADADPCAVLDAGAALELERVVDDGDWLSLAGAAGGGAKVPGRIGGFGAEMPATSEPRPSF